MCHLGVSHVDGDLVGAEMLGVLLGVFVGVFDGTALGSVVGAELLGANVGAESEGFVDGAESVGPKLGSSVGITIFRTVFPSFDSTIFAQSLKCQQTPLARVK